MSRPLHRDVSGGGGRFCGNSHDCWEDSQMKDRTDKEDEDRNQTNGTNLTKVPFKYPFQFLFPDNLSSNHKMGEFDSVLDPLNPEAVRSWHKVILWFLKFSLAVIVILALAGSVITSTSRGQILHGYRRLQEQLVSDMYEIGELSIATSGLTELDYCSQESENYVPCFNVSGNLAKGFSGGNEYTRHCGSRLSQNCLVLPPMNYRIPLRWPAGRDVIWFANVKIIAQEVLSSGSLTKRMMMLDEDQISFHSVSSSFDVEDYSHQIAEIIGLRNESYFIQAGASVTYHILNALHHLPSLYLKFSY